MARDEELAPALKKIDITIARLRLMLADVRARQEVLVAQQRTYREQREKLLTFGMYGDGSLDSVLRMLADVDDRLTDAERTERLLRLVRERAEAELESLQLTKGIEEAKSSLADVQRRLARGDADGPTRDALQGEIGRLRALIHDASERAAETVRLGAARVSAGAPSGGAASSS